MFYGDIDTMDKQADFTFDPVNFAGLPDFVDEQRAEGLRYVPIIDPAIPGNRAGYETYERGLRANAYVTTATGDILFGNVIKLRALDREINLTFASRSGLLSLSLSLTFSALAHQTGGQMKLLAITRF